MLTERTWVIVGTPWPHLQGPGPSEGMVFWAPAAGGTQTFSPNAWEAVRFSRRQDAERVLPLVSGGEFIVAEYAFSSTVTITVEADDPTHELAVRSWLGEQIAQAQMTGLFPARDVQIKGSRDA